MLSILILRYQVNKEGLYLLLFWAVSTRKIIENYVVRNVVHRGTWIFYDVGYFEIRLLPCWFNFASLNNSTKWSGIRTFFRHTRYFHIKEREERRNHEKLRSYMHVFFNYSLSDFIQHEQRFTSNKPWKNRIKLKALIDYWYYYIHSYPYSH